MIDFKGIGELDRFRIMRQFNPTGDSNIWQVQESILLPLNGM